MTYAAYDMLNSLVNHSDLLIPKNLLNFNTVKLGEKYFLNILQEIEEIVLKKYITVMCKTVHKISR